MAVHGQPRSYLDIDEGVDVITSDGHIVGKLAHVLADHRSDIFDGIVVDTSAGPGGHRFVDAPEVAGFRERAMLLKISAAEAEQPPSRATTRRSCSTAARRMPSRRSPRSCAGPGT